MSNINEKVKSLLAFYASFESFKADIENKLEQLSEISEEVKKAKFDAFAFDSARRTFGEEIGVLKSFVDKSIADINDSIEALDSSESVEQLKLSTDKQIKKLNDALAEQSKQTQELKRLLSSKDGTEKSIKSLIESVSSINKRIESMGK